MRSILLHATPDSNLDSRVAAACDLARATGGHVRALMATPYLEPLSVEAYSGVVFSGGFFEELDRAEKEAAARLEADLRTQGVPFDVERRTANVPKLLAAEARLADVVVMSRATTKPTAGLEILAEVAIAAPAPVLAVPPGATGFDATGPALIAWKHSDEAAAALKAALPLLKLASAVHLLTVAEPKADMPPTAVCRYLARHGIEAELAERPMMDRSPEEVILTHARQVGAAYIVMGAYGRPRALEWLIGGVSRHLLCESPLPLLLAH